MTKTENEKQLSFGTVNTKFYQSTVFIPSGVILFSDVIWDDQLIFFPPRTSVAWLHDNARIFMAKSLSKSQGENVVFSLKRILEKEDK